MFKIYKLYLKWKLNSLIKDKLIYYLKEKESFTERKKLWENKTYEKCKNDGACETIEQFEKRKKEQISYSYDMWKENYYKEQTVSEILKIIENL